MVKKPGKFVLSVCSLVCFILSLGVVSYFDTARCEAAKAAADIDLIPASFAELAKKASPSVVNISTVKTVKGGGIMPMPFGQGDPFRDFFERFFRDQMPRDFKQQSLGTGFIIDRQGYILTNNHVVEMADEIKVKLSDGKEYEAKIVGRDPKTDLALIKIESDEGLQPLPLGDSEKLEVGEWVVAIGNPFGLGNTVTAGIVSAKYRQIGASSYDNFIQTDASINPGNSGGPLLNTSGEVVGINTAIFSQSGGNIGIGFAIPVKMAEDLLPQLKKGRVVRGWLGVMVQKITPELREKLGLKDDKGALVADVTTGGPAEKAGIERGDVIVAFDGKEIKEMRDLPFVVASTPVDKAVDIEVIRKGERKRFDVKIGELKDEQEGMLAAEVKPRLGMSVEELTPELAKNLGLKELSGIVVVQVEDDSPAAAAGLRPGDVILEIDQSQLKSIDDFNSRIEKYKKGDTILLLAKRRGATVFMTLKVTD
ncbi:MAG: DegQ family serine endoprotease [Deltaproteobacteria bacterium]|nr:DegQ family serine endoprotease [Deltaproteobacteria bacterium]